VMDVFNRLGSIQYDPLDVVTQNASLVLQSRVKNYHTALLSELLYGEHVLMDGWDKMMSIFPSQDFNRFSLLRQEMQRQLKQTVSWRDQSHSLDYLDEVHTYVRHHGACTGKDISFSGTKKGSWGPSRISSIALDYLFHSGQLSVTSRKGSIKHYDLSERVLPQSAIKAEGLSDKEMFLRWYVLRRIGSLGLLWNKSGGGWLGPFIEKKDIRTPVLNTLLEEDRIVRVLVKDVAEPFFCYPEHIDLFESDPVDGCVRFLAPLDNMLWDRNMIKTLFGFAYTWEVYIPPAKRKYGYYVLPILCGEHFLGRMEPERYRHGNKFVVKNLWLESSISMTKTKKAALSAALQDFSEYLARS